MTNNVQLGFVQLNQVGMTLTDNNNPSGSEYTVIPSSEISNNSQIEYSAVFPENGEINPE